MNQKQMEDYTKNEVETHGGVLVQEETSRALSSKPVSSD